MGTRATETRNGQQKRKRTYLVLDFGAKCRYCGKPDLEFSHSPLAEKLEFAHKVNHRISGMNRGRNARIQEVINNKDHFWLGCKSCHRKYDEDHPLTEEEKRRMREEPPF